MAGPHDKARPEGLFRHRAAVITQV